MSRMMVLCAAGAVMVVGVMVSSAPGQISVNNGMMDDGYISTWTDTSQEPDVVVNDTMPLGWGNSARKLNNHAVMYFDMVNYYSAPASMRITNDSAAGATWTNGLQNVASANGAMVTISAMVKYENVTRCDLACVRACGGGQYCELNPGAYRAILNRASGTRDWYQVTLDVPAVTATECATTCPGRANLLMTIHATLTGPTGTYWVDNLTATVAGTPVRLGSYVFTGEAIRIESDRIAFDAVADYSVTLATANGKVMREFGGTAKEARLPLQGLAAGTYLVDVMSDRGYMTRSIAVGRKTR